MEGPVRAPEGQSAAPYDDGGQFCFCVVRTSQGTPVRASCVGNDRDLQDRGSDGCHECLGESQDGWFGKDHEHDEKRDYAQCCIFMQHPLCRRRTSDH